jgi:hypothetical protein
MLALTRRMTWFAGNGAPCPESRPGSWARPPRPGARFPMNSACPWCIARPPSTVPRRAGHTSTITFTSGGRSVRCFSPINLETGGESQNVRAAVLTQRLGTGNASEVPSSSLGRARSPVASGIPPSAPMMTRDTPLLRYPCHQRAQEATTGFSGRCLPASASRPPASSRCTPLWNTGAHASILFFMSVFSSITSFAEQSNSL